MTDLEFRLSVGAIGIVFIAVVWIIFVIRLQGKTVPDPLSDAQNAAVSKYMRENPAPSLLIDDNGVRPVYTLDDRFMQKINSIEINGKIYATRAVWKPELIGVRNSGTFLECTAHDTPTLLFDAVQLRQLKKDTNLILYCFMEVDFNDEEE